MHVIWPDDVAVTMDQGQRISLICSSSHGMLTVRENTDAVLQLLLGTGRTTTVSTI